MIQRIQTIYLLIASFLLILLFSNPIAEIMVTDKLYLTLWHNRIVSANDGLFAPRSNWVITVLLTVLFLIQIITIFLFKRRRVQIRLCIVNIILMAGLIGYIFLYTKYILVNLGGIKSLYLWPVVCPMIAIILNYLALRSIQKDEKLVHSYDRIR